MPDIQDTPLDFGILATPDHKPVTIVEGIAALASLIWVLLIWLCAPAASETQAAMGWGMTLLVYLVPLALIWGCALNYRQVKRLRQETAQLRGSLDNLRKTLATAQQNALVQKPPRAAQNAAMTTSATPKTDPSIAQDGGQEQADLALGLGDDAQSPMSRDDTIRALQFPDGPEDHDGIHALRLGLQDRDLSKLIRSAQDVLTLLSQEGIFMDDLRAEQAHPALWRQFAQGERGGDIMALAGITDRSSLALTAARLREDPVFRDAAHHFLRTFDRMLQSFEPDASDDDIAALVQTRTALAFMLFGKVMDIFD